MSLHIYFLSSGEWPCTFSKEGRRAIQFGRNRDDRRYAMSLLLAAGFLIYIYISSEDNSLVDIEICASPPPKCYLWKGLTFDTIVISFF